MLKPYVHLMRRPGASAFFTAGILGRMPISMIGLGIVILIARESGSYGLAGAVSGVAVIAGALTGPIQGRLVDRFGQRTLLLIGSVLCTIALAALLVAVRADAATWVMYASRSLPVAPVRRSARSSAPAGPICSAAAGPADRVRPRGGRRRGRLHRRPGPRHHARHPGQPVRRPGRGRSLGLAGGIWLALLRASDPPGRGKSNGAEQAPLPWVSIMLLSLIGLGLGATLGGTEVVTIAFTTEKGQVGLSGVLLAVWAFGSLLAGLWYGSVHWRAPVERRLLFGTILLAVTLAPLPWVDSVLMLGVVLFFCGLSIAPTMVAVTACVEEWVPPQRLTEAITWTVTGILLGVAPGNAASGHAVDSWGPSTAYWVPFSIGIACALVAALATTFARPKTRFAHN